VHDDGVAAVEEAAEVQRSDGLDEASERDLRIEDASSHTRYGEVGRGERAHEGRAHLVVGDVVDVRQLRVTELRC
jgi:hypothetical protein